jgi:3-oxoacyl-[acyl-carrier protein] reductase
VNTERFKDRTALVTGCGSDKGIGFATASLLGQSGATVNITSTTDRIFQRAQTLKDAGIEVHAYIADLEDKNQSESLAQSALQVCGRVDILVNNAGWTKVGEPEPSGYMAEMSHEDWYKIMDRNLRTCFNMTRALLPSMLKNKYGRIVNVSSATGPLVSNPGETAYSAAKAAMIGLSRSLAIETAVEGVTVNNVAPGWIATASSTEEERIAALNTPMKRAGTPTEVAQLIAFLASDEAAYITGQMIVIDGGNALQEYKGPSELFY